MCREVSASCWTGTDTAVSVPWGRTRGSRVAGKGRGAGLSMAHYNPHSLVCRADPPHVKPPDVLRAGHGQHLSPHPLGPHPPRHPTALTHPVPASTSLFVSMSNVHRSRTSLVSASVTTRTSCRRQPCSSQSVAVAAADRRCQCEWRACRSGQ